MFFPIRTDRRLRSTPVVNLGLIAVNVLIYLLSSGASGDDPIRPFVLDPVTAELHQFITYQFLHGGPMHLVGNMLFLYVFGNSVEDRLGKLGYLAFYLAGGVIAGLGHCLTESAPVVGASGSVSAVTGAYLALFPMSRVTIVYWFVIIGAFDIPSMYLILFQIAENVFFNFFGDNNVAYTAHLAGYGYGFVIGLGLLALRVLPREPYDMLSMVNHRRRRERFRSMARSGYKPWSPKTAEETPARTETSPRAMEIADLRRRIATAHGQNDLDSAAELYTRLLRLDPGHVLGRAAQADVANHLVSLGHYENAATAYELFLNTYQGDGQQEQIQLLLALIYTRYLNRRQRARELLRAAMPGLNSREQQNLAQQMLAELGS